MRLRICSVARLKPLHYLSLSVEHACFPSSMESAEQGAGADPRGYISHTRSQARVGYPHSHLRDGVEITRIPTTQRGAEIKVDTTVLFGVTCASMPAAHSTPGTWCTLNRWLRQHSGAWPCCCLLLRSVDLREGECGAPCSVSLPKRHCTLNCTWTHGTRTS